MIAWKRAVLLAFASWVIPFAFSFLIFPLKKSDAPLFETVMELALLIVAGVLFRRYFRDRAVSAIEAVAVGAVWTAMNLILDYPLFAYGPMKMPIWNYYSEIGFVYLTFPAFGFWASRLGRS